MSLSWYQKIRRYEKERFPVVLYALLIGLTLMVTSIDQPAAWKGRPFVTGFLLFFLFFLRLRLFDEIKDFEDDVRYRPERLVASGVVPLTDIKKWLIVVIGLELLTLAFMPLSFMVYYMVLSVYSVLMFFEFFNAGWLKRHFLVYGFSHMIIMGLVALSMRHLLTGEATSLRSFWICLAIFFSGYYLEVGRKLWRTDEEREGVETYSKMLGLGPAAFFFMFLFGAAHVAFYFAYPFAVLPMLVLFLIFTVYFVSFVWWSRKPLFKRMEQVTGIYQALLYAVLILFVVIY